MLGCQFANSWQQRFNRLGLRGMWKSRQQLFAQLDRLSKFVAANKFLDPHLQLLPFFDLSILLKRRKLLAYTSCLRVLGETIDQPLCMLKCPPPQATVDIVADFLNHPRNGRLNMNLAFALHAREQALRFDVAREI